MAKRHSRRRKSSSRRRHSRRRYSKKSHSRRRYSRRRSSSRVYRGGNRFVPKPPPLPPAATPYRRQNIFSKPVLPPIGNQFIENKYIPDWKERRNTFVEFQDRKSRNLSGQFHYPSR